MGFGTFKRWKLFFYLSIFLVVLILILILMLDSKLLVTVDLIMSAESELRLALGRNHIDESIGALHAQR